MIAGLEERLSAIVDLLAAFARERVPPEEAKTRLASIAGDSATLVWQYEPYDGSLHYDVLLDAGEEGVVSVSFCPDGELPWPMRGVHRWDEHDFMRVGGRVVTVQEVVAWLDFLWDEAPLLDRLVESCLVEEAALELGLQPTDAELQGELDEFRRRRDLHRAEDTRRWLDQAGLSHEQLENFLAVEVRRRMLRALVTEPLVQETFDRERDDFAEATIALVAFDTEEDARAARGRAVDRDGFYAEMEAELTRRGASDADALVATVHRGLAPPALAAAVFEDDSRAGAIVGPVPYDGRYALVRVLALARAELDERTRELVADRVFREWLAERRAATPIEVFWGPREREPAPPPR